MKKIIKVFFCILTCLIISIPQIYAEESKTKELSEAVEEKKDENVEESLDKGKKEVTEEPVEQSVLETIEKPAEVTSNGTTELPKTESTSETEEKPDEEPKKEPSICYTTHIQDIGWQDLRYDGEKAGTEGQSKRIEAIQIRIISKENDSDSQEEPKFERQEGTYGKTGLNVADKGGSELKYLKYGTGKNVFFATFAIHGYEDKWDKDGYELIDIAYNFYNKLL